MKIAHVVRQFSPSVGGLEEAVLKLGTTLKDRGFDIRVVTLDRIAKGGPEQLPRRDVIGGLPVHRIPFRGSWRYPVAPHVLREIRDVDLVHVHGIDFFFDFLALTQVVHRKPMVASTHGGFFHTAFAQKAKRIYFATVTRRSARAYGAICASSKSDDAMFAPIAGDRLILAPNGVDVEKWAGLAGPHPSRRLLYVGRFSSNKNIPALFPVLRELRSVDPTWAVTVAGSPWDVSAEALRDAAAQAGVSEAVTLLERPDDAGIGRAMQSASYIVSPSHHEGFGISIVEGLSAGLFPVLSRIPPFEVLIRDGGLGLLVDFMAPAATAQAIEQQHRAMMRDSLTLRERAMAAAKGYSWATSADAVQQAYAVAARGRTAYRSPSARTAP